MKWSNNLLFFPEFYLEVMQHVYCHAAEVIVGRPSPFAARAGVVHLVGPALCDALLQRVDVVNHLEVGLQFLYLGVDGLWRETHCGDVETVVVDKSRRVGFHYGDGCSQRVGHIHHVHHGAFLYRAHEFLAAHGRVVDVDSIVGGAAAGRCDVRDDAWEAHRAGVDTELERVVVAEQFSAHFCDAVHGSGLLDCVLRCAVFRSVWSEGADGAWCEHGAFEFAGHLQGVHQSADTDFPGQQRFVLCHGAEQGGEVVDGVDVVFLDGVGDLLCVGDVHFHRGSRFEQFSFRLGAFDVSGNDVSGRVGVSQFHCQFRADLSGGADNQYVFHSGGFMQIMGRLIFRMAWCCPYCRITSRQNYNKTHRNRLICRKKILIGGLSGVFSCFFGDWVVTLRRILCPTRKSFLIFKLESYENDDSHILRVVVADVLYAGRSAGAA